MNIATYIVNNLIDSPVFEVDSQESGGHFIFYVKNRITGVQRAFLFPADISLKDFINSMKNLKNVAVAI